MSTFLLSLSCACIAKKVGPANLFAVVYLCDTYCTIFNNLSCIQGIMISELTSEDKIIIFERLHLFDSDSVNKNPPWFKIQRVTPNSYL